MIGCDATVWIESGMSLGYLGRQAGCVQQIGCASADYSLEAQLFSGG